MTGLKLSSDFDHLELPDQEYPQLLWKLQRETADEEMRKYPEEIQIIVIDAYEGKYVMKPRDEDVRLKTFKQVSTFWD